MYCYRYNTIALEIFTLWCRCDGRAFILDYSQDEVLEAERFDFLRLRLYDEILQMIQLGADYGRRIDEQGLLDKHLASIRRA